MKNILTTETQRHGEALGFHLIGLVFSVAPCLRGNSFSFGKAI